MSVLIKRIDSSSGGGSSKGYPPGNVTNVKIKNGPITKDGKSKIMYLSWKDPDDIVVGDKTISTWERTIVVRSKEKVPSNYPSSDGVTVVGDKHERNSWTEKDPWKDFIWLNRDTYGTYYYRFFTINTDGVINQSPDMIYKVEVKEYDTVLSKNTWDQIAAASESGTASDIWKVGDEIDIKLSGTYNETITLQIWDFNHFDKSDGSGKAGICFGCKYLSSSINSVMCTRNSNSEWADTYMRNTTMSKVLNSMPAELQSVIKEVKLYTASVKTNSSTGQTVKGKGTLSQDKVFIPGFTEIFGASKYSMQSACETGQKKISIFTDSKYRIKTKSDGAPNSEYWWWTRSPEVNRDNFQVVTDTGNYRSCPADDLYWYTCFCFNV